MATLVKRIDQTRHEAKALRYLLHFHPQSLSTMGPVPAREDFQIPDSRLIYDVLVNARTEPEATEGISKLDLEEIDVDSFLRLGGEHYHTYPALIRQRAQEFRDGKLELERPG